YGGRDGDAADGRIDKSFSLNDLQTLRKADRLQCGTSQECPMCQTLYSLWNGKKCDRCLLGIVIQDRSGPVIQRRPEAGVVKSVGVDLAEAGRQHQLFQTA